MNEFNKLKWNSTSDKSYLERQVCTFIPNDFLKDSYIYQSVRGQLDKPPKISVRKEEVKFIPGGYCVPNFQEKSSLTQDQHEQCLNAMKVLRLNKPSYQLKQLEISDIDAFNGLKYKISEENEKFNQFVRNSWESDKKRIVGLKNNLYRYGTEMNKRKAERYLEYKRYYKEKDLINMNYIEDDMVTVEVISVGNLLELGTVAKFSQPSLKVLCKLSAQTLPPLQSIKNYSNLPVSKDQNIKALLRNHDFDVVISISGLKRLLDNTDLKEKWTIPIVVESINVPRGKHIIKKKVVYIDKPLVKLHPDSYDLKYYSMKRLVRTNFCQYEAFKFQFQENSEEKKPESDKKDEENENIFPWKNSKGKNDIIHHNANYRLWNLQKVFNSSNLMKNQIKNTKINLLVRYKLDACENIQGQALSPVIVTPKIECQLQYGACVPSKSELSREWTSLFFRPFSNLYRVRMHWRTAEVVNLDKCSIQKVNNEAIQLYNYKPNLGLGVLNEVLTKLVELNDGNYLLAHLPKHGSFVELLEESTSPTSVDLHSEYEKWSVVDDIEKNWNPIDPKYILPIHDRDKRLPGCFIPPVIKTKPLRTYKPKFYVKKKSNGESEKKTQ